MARFEDLALKDLAAADHIAHALLRFARDASHDQFTGAIVAREIGRITFIVLAVHARPRGDERRRNHLAGIP